MKNLLIFLLAVSYIFSAPVNWNDNNLANFKSTSTTPKQAPAKLFGKISRLNADMKITRANGEIIHDAKLGDEIRQGDIIEQFYGNSQISLTDGSVFSLDEKTSVKIDNNGIALLQGNTNLNLKNTSNIQTPSSNLNTTRSNLSIKANPKSYIAKDDEIEVFEGLVNVSVPKGVDNFELSYQNSDKIIKTPRFRLNKGEIAIFDGKYVKIINQKAQKPRPDEKIRLFVGLETNLAYVQKTVQNAPLRSRERLDLKAGINLGLLQTRLDPNYVLTLMYSKEILELKFEFTDPIESKFRQAVFETTPYYKLGLGLGNTDSQNYEPTHFMLEAGFGVLKKIDDFLVFFDVNLARRYWQFDRKSLTPRQTEQDTEIYMGVKALYRFRW